MKSRHVIPGNAGHHAVHFYDDSERLCRSVADFLGDGLAARQPVVVVAIRGHARRIRHELSSRHFDVDHLERAGRLTILDATETLEQFMDGGRPNPVRFQRVIGNVLRSARRRSNDPTVRAYGEMVNVLWGEGQREAAIELERLWNQLAESEEFSLLCGYALATTRKRTSRQAICAQHTHVLA